MENGERANARTFGGFILCTSFIELSILGILFPVSFRYLLVMRPFLQW